MEAGKSIVSAKPVEVELTNELVQFIYHKYQLDKKAITEAVDKKFIFKTTDHEYEAKDQEELESEFRSNEEGRLINKYCNNHGSYWDGDVDFDKEIKMDPNSPRFLKVVEEDRVNSMLQTVLPDTYDELASVTLTYESKAITKLSIFNVAGLNHDSRGRTKADKWFDYYGRVTLEDANGVNLAKLTEALYKIKSHKFDFWYELCGSCTIYENVGDVRLDVDFDHGS